MEALVTAIMPTRGEARAKLAAQAVYYFLSQTYKKKQLLILDDSDDPSFKTPIIYSEGVCYLRNDERLNIPQKRNLLCRLAAGEFICHFDSDDYSASHRIADQVDRLVKSDKAVTGYSSMIFKDIEADRFFIYRGSGHYALGTSLMYRRSWWKDNPFREDKRTGEDNDFVHRAVDYRQFISFEGGERMCARLHSDNTNKRNDSIFEPIDRPGFANLV